MDADERLTALKKAYADIILNTAKEAAARIMVSERKALRFQHELSAAKEDALHMLLRLKQMMDSKNRETEMASVSQQKKIDELEAQLQEAEDIVNDLREELRGVQAELEKAAKVKETRLERRIITSLETPAEHRLEISQSEVLHPPELQCESISVSDMGYSDINQRNEGQKFYSTLVHMGNSYVCKPDLPSIILRSKEPELYRNGCTQRIRACERSPLNEELSFNEVNEVKHESAVKDEKEGERTHKAPFCEPDTMCNKEKNEVHHEDSRVSRWSGAHVVKSIRKKRTRASRFSRNHSCQYEQDQINKADLIPDISCLNSPNSAEDGAHSGEDPFEMAQRVSSETNELGHGCTDTVNGVKTGGDELVSARQEISECVDRSEAPIDQTNLGKVYLPLVSSESKASENTVMIPLHPVADRVIKYTFQRKRKRETLNSSEGNVEGMSNISERNPSIGIAVGEKENSSLEPENSSLIGESSRDSRRLSQVARQLISMSEKKWWQQ